MPAILRRSLVKAMLMALPAASTVPNALIDACIDLVGHGAQLRDLTVRSITQRSGVSLSAVSYHFGSLDALVAVVAQRVYARINLRRVELFQRAVESSQPDPPRLRDVLEALIRRGITGQGAAKLVKLWSAISLRPTGRRM